MNSKALFAALLNSMARNNKNRPKSTPNTRSSTLFRGNVRNLEIAYHNNSRWCSFESPKNAKNRKNPWNVRIQGLEQRVNAVCSSPQHEPIARLVKDIDAARFDVAWCFFARLGVRRYFQGVSNSGHEYQLQLATKRLKRLNRAKATLKTCVRLPRAPLNRNNLYRRAAARWSDYINKTIPSGQAMVSAQKMRRTNDNILNTMARFGYRPFNSWKLQNPGKIKYTNIMRATLPARP